MLGNLLWRYIIVAHAFAFICKSSAKEFNPKKFPTLIWWSDLLFPHTTKSKELKCSLGNCITSMRRKYQSDSVPIAYIFYGTDFTGTSLPLPRKSNHLWTLLHEESPMNNYIFSHTSGIKLFNFSGSFSRYSDFPLATQHLPNLEYLKRKPLSISIKNQYRRNGTAPVMYLQSHCNVASDRDRYIQQLMKFIKIDSYGTCLHNKDLPSDLSLTDTHNDENLFSFISKYKFHLAFENAICDDYMTEKIFRALHVGSVPIYKGSSTIKDWLPSPTSAVIADDFKSPEELAKFISELDENDHLYEKYLTYKQKITNDFLINHMINRIWGVNDPNKVDFLEGFECYVCDKLQTFHELPTSIANKQHMNCPQPHPSLELNASISIKNDKWFQEDWAENYWFAFDQAKAIELMIKNKENDTSNFWNYISLNKY